MSAIQKSGTNFGTTSICRVPLAQRGGQIMPSVTTGCVSCVSGDGIEGGPVWWTHPYTKWAAKRKADKKQKRQAEAPVDPEVEARLKALRAGSGAGPSGSGDGGAAPDADSELEPDVEARLRALREG